MIIHLRLTSLNKGWVPVSFHQWLWNAFPYKFVTLVSKLEKNNEISNDIIPITYTPASQHYLKHLFTHGLRILSPLLKIFRVAVCGHYNSYIELIWMIIDPFKNEAE